MRSKLQKHNFLKRNINFYFNLPLGITVWGENLGEAMPTAIRTRGKATKIAFTILGVPVPLRSIYKLPNQKKEPKDTMESVANTISPTFQNFSQWDYL